MPDLPTKISSKLIKFANSSIDISDGLFGDLSKLINTSNLYFRLDVEKIPISSKLKTYLIKTNKKKKVLFLKEMIIKFYLHHQNQIEDISNLYLNE